MQKLHFCQRLCCCLCNAKKGEGDLCTLIGGGILSEGGWRCHRWGAHHEGVQAAHVPDRNDLPYYNTSYKKAPQIFFSKKIMG